MDVFVAFDANLDEWLRVGRLGRGRKTKRQVNPNSASSSSLVLSFLLWISLKEKKKKWGFDFGAREDFLNVS